MIKKSLFLSANTSIDSIVAHLYHSKKTAIIQFLRN